MKKINMIYMIDWKFEHQIFLHENHQFKWFSGQNADFAKLSL